MLESQEAERAVSKVRSALDEAGAEDIAITMAEGTIFTVEDAAGTLGVPPSEILKSLVFLVDGNPCLVLSRASPGRRPAPASRRARRRAPISRPDRSEIGRAHV